MSFDEYGTTISNVASALLFPSLENDELAHEMFPFFPELPQIAPPYHVLPFKVALIVTSSPTFTSEI